MQKRFLLVICIRTPASFSSLAPRRPRRHHSRLFPRHGSHHRAPLAALVPLPLFACPPNPRRLGCRQRHARKRHLHHLGYQHLRDRRHHLHLGYCTLRDRRHHLRHFGYQHLRDRRHHLHHLGHRRLRDRRTAYTTSATDIPATTDTTHAHLGHQHPRDRGTPRETERPGSVSRLYLLATLWFP